MAQRIYSLAKELNIDSKVLVELCLKAGVTGKGSALASLTDEETAKIRAFVTSPGSRSAPSVAARPSPAPAGTATAEPPVFRREDYIPPTAAGGKPPVLARKPEMPGGESKRRPTDGDRGARSGPAIRVAPLPTAQQPPPPAASEPAPQKPDLKLPADAIRAGRSGAKPLQEHLRKHEAKRKADVAKGKPAPARGLVPPAAPPGDVPAGRERGRKGAKGPHQPDADFAAALGGREQRQLSRKRVATPARFRPSATGEDESGGRIRRARAKPKRTGTSTAAPRKSNVVLQLPATVRSFSEAIGVPVKAVLGKLLALGTELSTNAINAEMDSERVQFLALEFGVEIELRQPVDLEDQLLSAVTDREDDPEQLELRPPVVTFLGHVDHGKTSLLDRIIGIDVASGESGGITQHIRAYRVERDGRTVSFVDTPGHEAFTEMRARGANVTDVAVLVVAADDGVMPQTEEAISHAHAAGVPIVVALNKVDLPGINYDRIYSQLVTAGLQPTEWGGDTELVKCSALTGQGIDELLETLLTIAELHDYKANPHRPAFGTCLEAELHEGRGVVAKLLVQNGTLKIGDVIVCGPSFGRVKAMYDTLHPGATHQSAGPSMPVNVTGLNVAPGAGDRFVVLDKIDQARDIAEKRASATRVIALGGAPTHVTLETLFERLGGDGVQTLNLILRADVRGSIEAIRKEFTKLEHPEVQIKILQATVGGITEADVHLADASDAIIIGFNVVPDEGARSLAEEKGVQIRRYDIIYQVTDDLKKALEGLLKPEHREVDLGRALVQRTFTISRVGTIAGCRVLAGTIERNSRVRVIRDSRVIGDYPLESLRREKDDVREVREGFECGMKLAGFNDVKEGDVLEDYRVEEVARTL
ncbi:MAG: translation initiation factor IF-2 [Planctomycetia bacterium]|nr:translation initiation factor IF-2 [Planctomycetia bacterium]